MNILSTVVFIILVNIPQHAFNNTDSIIDAVNNENRSLANKNRDIYRNPTETLKFFEINREYIAKKLQKKFKNGHKYGRTRYFRVHLIFGIFVNSKNIAQIRCTRIKQSQTTIQKIAQLRENKMHKKFKIENSRREH